MSLTLLAPLALALRRAAFFGAVINTGMALLTGIQTSVMLACVWFGAAVLASQWLARIKCRQGTKRMTGPTAVSTHVQFWYGARHSVASGANTIGRPSRAIRPPLRMPIED